MTTNNTSIFTFLSFFTFWAFWTLNGASGKDMADVVIQYWDNKGQQQVQESELRTLQLAELKRKMALTDLRIEEMRNPR